MIEALPCWQHNNPSYKCSSKSYACGEYIFWLKIVKAGDEVGTEIYRKLRRFPSERAFLHIQEFIRDDFNGHPLFAVQIRFTERQF